MLFPLKESTVMSNPRSSFVQFYDDVIELKAESEKQGRPIFKEVAHIRKTTPGDPSNIVERVAEEFDIKQHPREYEQYKRQTAAATHGTPLEQWPQITRAQVKECKYYEVHSVEQLAELSDMHCQNMGMGVFELREKAKAYLGVAESTAAATAQALENEKLRQEMAELRAMIAENAEKKVGRPRKEQEVQS